MTGRGATQKSLKQIRAVALDVDGTLTDGGLWWGAQGEELKRFCFADIMGLSLARRAGLELALISGEDSPAIDRFAEKTMIQHVVKGCRDKATAVKEFAAAAGISLNEICFMGDDINDLPALQIAGLSSAPANAARDVLSRAEFVAKRAGGEGAVRELIEAILDAKGLNLQEVLQEILDTK